MTNIPLSKPSLRELVEARGLTHVKVGLTDLDGVMRGKLLAADSVVRGIEGGLTFCDCIVGWDSDDTLYTNNPKGITGWHTGYPDTPIRVVADAVRDLPGEFGGKGVLAICELAGQAEPLCPRTRLRKVLETARTMGYEPVVGFEYEFSLFAETPQTARAKGYSGLTPMTPGNFGYSVLRTASGSDFGEGLLAELGAMGVPVQALHTENGPGMWEAAIAPSNALEAADRAAVFKTFVKTYAQRRGLMATFMAKWSVEHQGQGGHIHISLRDAEGGAPLFHDAADPLQVSPTLRQFVGGQLAFMAEMACVVAPTVNAYTRLVPGAWAPTAATWGLDNRTCALRVVGATPDARRVEFRVAGADANPYLALAAALASGLEGIEAALDAPAPRTGNAYLDLDPPAERLPPTLSAAADRLRGSKTARRWFGDAFVDHFAATRAWEEAQFRAAVTDWELRRYFEII